MCNFYIQVKPVIDLKVRGLCCKPYYNHPRGCPNFNKKSNCPPRCPIIDETLDLSKPVYVIYNVFDFEGHCNKMRQKFPNWSEHQIKCVLYWQPKARALLRQKIKDFQKFFPDLKIIDCPEAQGINLTATMKSIGIELEWPPVKRAYQIVLAGTPKI